jgi:transposase
MPTTLPQSAKQSRGPCPTAHHWSRRVQALGHTVRLLPPSYVKAYLKRSKNRITRARLLEFFAALSPCLVGIEAKSEEQQSALIVSAASTP